MKLATPITITITEQRLGPPAIELPRGEDGRGYMKIPVIMLTDGGAPIFSTHITLDKPAHAIRKGVRKITTKDGKGQDIVSEEAYEEPVILGECQRLAFNPTARTLAEVFKVDQFVNHDAFNNARMAMKSAPLDGELEALEAVGIADGWLLPVKEG